MVYNIIKKNTYSTELEGFKAKINLKNIRLGSGFIPIFEGKQRVLLYLDIENKKIAMKPTANDNEAYKVKIEDKGCIIQAQKLLKQIEKQGIVFKYNNDINGVGEGYEAEITLR